MDLETKLRSENYDSLQPMQFQEMDMKSTMKDLEPPSFGVPSSQGNFLQDVIHIDPIQANGSSPNPHFGVQNPNFINPFDQFTYGCSPADLDDVYESKPFADNNFNKGQAQHVNVMDNFQYGGNNNDNSYHSLNLPQRNHHQMEMMDANQSNYNYVTFDSQEIMKSMNFVVPDDEVSCISPDPTFCSKVGLNDKNNIITSPPKRACKVRNKSNVVKGQWTIEEDRYIKKV